MIRKYSIFFSLAAILIGASVFAQGNSQDKAKEKEKEKEKSDSTWALQSPDYSPLTFSFGSDSYLGVFLEEVTPERVKELNLTEERGAVIMKVAEGSPAEKAGLKANDVIVSFNGRRIDTVRELQRLLTEAPAGRTVSFEVLRGGVSQTISATLAKRSQSQVFGNWNDDRMKLFEQGLQRSEAARDRETKRAEELLKRQQDLSQWKSFPNDFGSYNFNLASGLFRGSRLGVSVESMSEQLATYFGVKDGKGVLVTEVRENSAAAKAGLKAGDVILDVDGQKVASVNDLMGALAKKTEGTLVVRLLRKGEEKTVNVTLEKVEPRPPRNKRAFVYSQYYNVV